MTFRAAAIVTCATIFLAGCGTPMINRSCDWAMPIRPSQEDVLTDQTALELLIHNETGARLCGWRP